METPPETPPRGLRSNIILNDPTPDDVRRQDVHPFLLQHIAKFDGATVRIRNEHPRAFKFHMFCPEGRAFLRETGIANDLPQMPPQRKEAEIANIALKFMPGDGEGNELPTISFRMPRSKAFDAVFRKYRRECEKYPVSPLRPRYGLHFVNHNGEEWETLDETDSPETKHIKHMEIIWVHKIITNQYNHW